MIILCNQIFREREVLEKWVTLGKTTPPKVFSTAKHSQAQYPEINRRVTKRSGEN